MSEAKVKGERWLDVGMGWCVRYEYSPTWLDFEAFEVVGEEMSPRAGAKLFHKKGSANGGDTVYTVEESEPDITGFVKWDGCSEMKIGTPHFCGASDVERLGTVMTELHKLCLLLPNVDRDCAGYPAPTPTSNEGDK